MSSLRNRVAQRRFRLLPGSELLRTRVWRQAERAGLMWLIRRFAVNEDRSRRRATPTYVWRSRRLRAVAIFELRFERVPDLFRAHYLLPLKSYYVMGGKYLWPANGQAGDPVNWRAGSSLD